MGDAPDPVADWVREADAKLDEVDESLERTNAAEDLRETAETASEAAEGLRDTAEGLRDDAETAREEAEVLRVEAEAARMGFVPKGDYDAETEYKHGDWVSAYGGSYGYIYPTPSTGVPVTDASHWQQIAEKGLKGDTGATGATGPKGDPGDVNQSQMDAAISAAVDPVISQLAEKANQGDMLNQSELVWTVGNINSTTGAETVALNRLRSDLLNIRGIIRITFSTIRMICICFNGSACLGVYPVTYAEDVINMADVLAVYPTTTHVRFVAKRTDDSNMETSDASSARLVEYKSTQSVYELIDNNKADIDTKVSDAVSRITTAKQLAWVLGTINTTTGAESESTTRIRCEYIAFEDLDAITVANSARINIAAYDAHKNLLGTSDWLAANVTRTRSELLAAYPSIAYVRILVMATSTAAGTNITVTALTALNRISNWRKAIDGRTDGRYRFDDKFKIVAYSTIGVAPINTAEHFLYCAKNGFDGLKCDVRITSDDKLVLCHDDGFTLDGNGRITTFNNSSKTLIRAMTYAEVIALEHAQQYESAYCHPIGMNTFLRICKRYGKLPYITIRDEYIETIAPLLITALRQYGMTRGCIVNSFTYDSLMAVRALDANIYLSEVFTPYNSTLRTAALTHAKANDNYMLAVFYADGTNTLSTMTSNAGIVTFIANCIAAGIRLYGGQSTTDEEIDSIISLGFSGTQHKTVPVD